MAIRRSNVDVCLRIGVTVGGGSMSQRRRTTLTSPLKTLYGDGNGISASTKRRSAEFTHFRRLIKETFMVEGKITVYVALCIDVSHLNRGNRQYQTMFDIFSVDGT